MYGANDVFSPGNTNPETQASLKAPWFWDFETPISKKKNEILKLKTHTSGYLNFCKPLDLVGFQLSSRHTHLHFVRHPWIHRTRSAPEQGGILGRGSLKHSGRESVTVVLFHVLEVGERWFTANNGVYENKYIYIIICVSQGLRCLMFDSWFQLNSLRSVWNFEAVPPYKTGFPRCNFHSRVARKAPFGMHQFSKAEENTKRKSKYHKQPLNSHRSTKFYQFQHHNLA